MAQTVTYKLIDSGPIDLQTRRLISLCNAFRDSEAVDRDLGAMLVRRAKSVRAFAQALEWGLVADTLDAMEKIAAEGGAQPAVQESLARALKSMRGRIKFERVAA